MFQTELRRCRLTAAPLAALMTIGKLKELLEPLADGLQIIIVGPVLDDDGDECEAWFAVRDVTQEIDRDTAEDYARFKCYRLEDYLNHDGGS